MLRVATDICTVMPFFSKMSSFASYSKHEEKRFRFSFLDCFVRGNCGQNQVGFVAFVFERGVYKSSQIHNKYCWELRVDKLRWSLTKVWYSNTVITKKRKKECAQTRISTPFILYVSSIYSLDFPHQTYFTVSYIGRLVITWFCFRYEGMSRPKERFVFLSSSRKRKW